jgi:hypothetical protein
MPEVDIRARRTVIKATAEAAIRVGAAATAEAARPSVDRGPSWFVRVENPRTGEIR